MEQTKLRSDYKQIGNYVLEKVLGQGQFGKVFKSRSLQNNQFYAIKKIAASKIDSNPILEKLLKTEISIMQDINHINILHLFEFMKTQDHYYLVMNYCNQGDLEHYMKSKQITYFEESDAINLLKQISNGFVELLKRKIIHRDFKLANIFMNNDILIIGDFGMSKQGDVGSTVLGTPMTMAPELLMPEEAKSMGTEDDEYKIQYTSKADLWSIGVVYYQLLFGETPFQGNSIPELTRNIKLSQQLGLKFPREVTQESTDLLSKILVIDPSQRLDWKDFFQHKIFSDGFLENLKQVNKNKLETTLTPVMQKSIDDEFNYNKNYNIDSTLKQKVEVKAVDPKLIKVSEKQLDDKEQLKYFQGDIFDEIQFRYNHELNKITFLIYTIKYLDYLRKQQKLKNLELIILSIESLILIKCKALNSGVLGSLKRKLNILHIKVDHFAQFAQTNAYVDVQYQFGQFEEWIEEFIQIFVSRVCQKNLQLRYMHAIKQDLFNLAQIDQALRGELGQYQQGKLNLGVIEERIKREVENGQMLINYCINSEQTFQYFIRIQPKKQKFNWKEFIKMISNKISIQ